MMNPVHPFDSPIHGHLFVSGAVRELFSVRAQIQAWLDVEAALALAQGELGVIPADAAATIAANARMDRLDLEALERRLVQTAHPLVPLLEALATQCGEAGAHVHWGATTQDIIDSGMALCLKNTYALLEQDLLGVIERLCELAQRYRATPMAGRTHGQHAAPTTFGFKVAVWAEECLRHLERLDASRPRVLMGQLSGAVGTMTALGPHARQVQRQMCQKLGLYCPTIAWHGARDGVAEFVSLAGLIGATLGKIANEVVQLQRTEIAELEEPFQSGKVGSSTMPHKRNPIHAETIVASARTLSWKSGPAIEAMIHAHERDGSAWLLEWTTVPEAACLVASLLAQIRALLQGLVVNEQRMGANLGILDGLICSEVVMFALARHLGRMKAHDIVYAASMRAFETDTPFADCLFADPLAARYLDRAELQRITRPDHCLGEAIALVDELVERARRRLEQRQTPDAHNTGGVS